ncbi:methyltransferase domain-containing protein [Nitrosovibrio sp. Nv4]|uniref:methyltransferase domain-containing protein n=1 Tax=Nitrosovibrio sp. Nv4 TaxID=1945880 RepID=UPI000BDC27BE|nr:methyltransferase domain-containing protein [Nitrosovibrio sp. Nv4]SOD40090.1 Methyltransferase domain-containing protein [Nitrosovibrio sp. Nv4]
MTIYNQYTKRDRFRVGIKIKLRQARSIYELGICHFNNPKHILEIGPGDGYIAALTRDDGFSYTAVEGSDSVASRLRNEGFSVVQSYVPPLPPEIRGSQICFLLHVIEHLTSAAEASQLISQIRSALDEDGILVIACPDYVKWGHYFFDCDYTHAMPFTRRRLQQLLRDHQFEIVEETIYSGPLFGYRSLLLAWFAKLFYPQIVDDVVGRFIKRDALSRGLFTLLPNLLVVARKL